MLPEEDDEKTEFLNWVLVEKVGGEESKFLAASIDGNVTIVFLYNVTLNIVWFFLLGMRVFVCYFIENECSEALNFEDKEEEEEEAENRSAGNKKKKPYSISTPQIWQSTAQMDEVVPRFA